MYTITDFKSIARPECMVITQHSYRRFLERQISIDDVCCAIQNGEIIEQYPNDFPFPSCLILGNAENKLLHICASIDDGMIYVITAYVPDPDKWDIDFKTRKESTP